MDSSVSSSSDPKWDDDNAWFPFLVSASDTRSAAAKEVSTPIAAGATFYRSNSHSARLEAYVRLINTLQRMSMHGDDLPFFVEKHIADGAVGTIAALYHHTSLDAPKLLTQDGDLVTLTWKRGRLTKMVSMDDENTSISGMNMDDFSRWSRALSGNADERTAELVQQLGSQASSAAT